MYDHASALRNCVAHYYLSAFVPCITRYMLHVRSFICVKLNYILCLLYARSYICLMRDRTCLSSTFMSLIYAWLAYVVALFKITPPLQEYSRVCVIHIGTSISCRTHLYRGQSWASLITDDNALRAPQKRGVKT